MARPHTGGAVTAAGVAEVVQLDQKLSATQAYSLSITTAWLWHDLTLNLTLNLSLNPHQLGHRPRGGRSRSCPASPAAAPGGGRRSG